MDSNTFGGDRFNDRDPELFGELLRIDSDPFSMSFIHHVQADNHRIPELEQLQRKLQTAREDRGVDDVDDGIWRLLKQEVAGGAFGGI